jgi:hypothetical protein
MIYNPLKEKVHRRISLPLYYTGLTTTASIREKEGPAKQYKLNRDYSAEVELELAPEGYTWLAIE